MASRPFGAPRVAHAETAAHASLTGTRAQRASRRGAWAPRAVRDPRGEDFCVRVCFGDAPRGFVPLEARPVTDVQGFLDFNYLSFNETADAYCFDTVSLAAVRAWLAGLGGGAGGAFLTHDNYIDGRFTHQHAAIDKVRKDKLLPTAQPFRAGQFARCAIVNSGHTTRCGANWGAVIDGGGYEAVFRTNDHLFHHAKRFPLGCRWGTRTDFAVNAVHEAFAAHEEQGATLITKTIARQDSAEDFSRLNALLCTATDWIFIPAYCFAIPRQESGQSCRVPRAVEQQGPLELDGCCRGGGSRGARRSAGFCGRGEGRVKRR